MIYLIGAAAVAAAWRFGDWRHWERYYPTILYLIIGDLTYNMLFQGHLLWKYQPEWMGPILGSLFVMITAYPAMVLIYLSRFPNHALHAVFYVLAWVVLVGIIEWVLFSTSRIVYSGSWSLSKSLLVSLGMFLLLKLHYHRPLLVWPISFALAFLLIWILPNSALPG